MSKLFLEPQKIELLFEVTDAAQDLASVKLVALLGSAQTVLLASAVQGGKQTLTTEFK